MTAPATPFIATFNTGRQYTAQGQRIAYTEIAQVQTPEARKVKVLFADVDRGVYGVVVLFVASDEGVLHAYDKGFYNRDGEYPERYPEQLAACKAAAESI